MVFRVIKKFVKGFMVGKWNEKIYLGLNLGRF